MKELFGNSLKIGVVCICVFVAIVIFLLVSNKPQSNTVNQPGIVAPTPLDVVENSLPVTLSLSSVVIGQTTADEIETLPDVQKSVTNSNGYTTYPIGTDTLHPNEVITQNNVAIFKREQINSQTDPNPPTLSYYLSKYGNPEEKIQGSKFYGRNAYYYIYPARGLALIANVATAQVFELQFFVPTTLDTYERIYGDDIQTGHQINY